METDGPLLCSQQLTITLHRVLHDPLQYLPTLFNVHFSNTFPSIPWSSKWFLRFSLTT